MIKIRQATKKGFVEMINGGVCDLNYVSSKTRRGRVQGKGQISPTVCAENPSIFRITKGENEEMANAEDYRIRKLTARECGRLMNVPEDAIDRMHTIESESQRYKAYGNSIVVNCLVAIFGQMLPGKEEEYKKI